MKKIAIQGKDYIPVHERLMQFWADHPGWSIRSEILDSEPGVVRFQASIIDDQGTLRATGHSEEKEGSSFINKTSYIENAETSAVGRALGFLGIGIDTSLASFEEVANAIVQKDDFIDRSSPTYDDPRPWMSQAQLEATIKRFHEGEKDVVEKAKQTFRMKGDYRKQLEAL